jgi:flavin-dependent dehydrogenase
MTDTDVCHGLRASIPGRWRERLAVARLTAARIAGSVVWGPRVFPAVSQRLGRVASDAPWLAVGDAALAVDPISGSGVVRALRTAREAAPTVLSMLTGDERRLIAAYEAERDRECAQYLRERALYYRAERRWDSAPFWRRRICN